MDASWQHLHIAFDKSVVKTVVRKYLRANNYEVLRKDFTNAEHDILKELVDAFKSIGINVYRQEDDRELNSELKMVSIKETFFSKN